MNRIAPSKALLFDLGDVLFTWSADTKTSIPARTLRSMLKTDIWAAFDCGCIEQNECYTKLGEAFQLSSSDVDTAFTQAFNSLQPNLRVITAIKQTKRVCKSLKVFAMSNMPKEFHTMLSAQIAKWNIFDFVFISGIVGTRKPDPAFYEHVLLHIQMEPQNIIFFDDKSENVLAAQKMGIQAHMFKENDLVIDTLNKLQNDPLQKAYTYLADHSDKFESVTDSGVTIADNFALLLIQETLSIDGLVEHKWDQKSTWNFFIGDPVLVSGNKFPDDLDTTSLALMVVPPDDSIANSVLDRMLEYACDDGRFQTYFDWSKPRFDEIVSTNVLTCFYHFNRGHELSRTLDMIHNMLKLRTYVGGTRYYPSADCCLYFIARLLHSSNDTHLHAKIGSLLRSRLEERVGQNGNAIELAMRIVACCSLDIDCRVDLGPLLASQQDDGSWSPGWMYQYGSTKVQLGNRGVTTAMAVRAIAAVNEKMSYMVESETGQKWCARSSYLTTKLLQSKTSAIVSRG